MAKKAQPTPREERAAARPKPVRTWRDFVAGILDVTDAPSPPVFRETCDIRFGRQFALAGFRSPSLRVTRATGPDAAGDIDGIAAHLVAAGRIEGRMGLRAVAAGRSDFVFYDLQEGVDLRFEQATSERPDLMLWFARARLPKVLADYDALHGLTIRGDTAAGALIGAGLTALSTHGAKASEREFDAMAEGVLAMIAAAIAPALDPARVGPALASFVTIRRHIDKNLHAPGLNAGSLARTFGLSRASLYRLFEPVGGVADYIRTARLKRAYKEIVDAQFADRRIGPIAYGLGFKNVSAFNRMFRHNFGASPRELRAQRAPVESSSSEAMGHEGELTLRAWLAQAGAAQRAR